MVFCHNRGGRGGGAAALCAKRGGARKVLQSVKSNEYISSVGPSWDMFNLEGPHLPYFMAILLLFYGIFWLKMAILGHRQSQRPQMGWTLVEHGWTLYFTSGGVSLGPFCTQKIAFRGPRTPQKWFFLPKMAINGHRWSQGPQIDWTLVGHE